MGALSSSMLVGSKGAGLAPRCRTMNAFKMAAYGLVLIGAAGLVNFVVAQHASGLDINALLVANNMLQMIGSLCLFAIGLGLYQGRRGFVPEAESSG